MWYKFDCPYSSTKTTIFCQYTSLIDELVSLLETSWIKSFSLLLFERQCWVFLYKNIAFWLHCSDSSAWTVGWLLSERRCRTEPFFCTKNVALLGALSCPSQACHQKKAFKKQEQLDFGRLWIFYLDSVNLIIWNFITPMLWLWILLTVFIC